MYGELSRIFVLGSYIKYSFMFFSYGLDSDFIFTISKEKFSLPQKKNLNRELRRLKIL